MCKQNCRWIELCPESQLDLVVNKLKDSGVESPSIHPKRIALLPSKNYSLLVSLLVTGILVGGTGLNLLIPTFAKTEWYLHGGPHALAKRQICKSALTLA